ncbi:MAG TPA: ribbon-helix-helix domain-containing protein [Bauldia sp.]|nr:ribbon-helix-helix domain-containing protein [Bauldia sp.]
MAKRSITIAGHRTSISLEEPFWRSLAEIAAERARPMAAVIAEIDRTRPPGSNLSSAIRVFVLEWARATAARRF